MKFQLNPSINLIFDPFPYPSNWLMRWTSPLVPIKVPLIHIMRAANPVTQFFCLAAFLWGDPKRAVAWWRTPLLRRGPWLGGWGLAGATRGRSCKKGTVPVFVLFIYIYWLVVWNIFPLHLRLSASPTCPHTTCPHTPCQHASCHTTCPHTTVYTQLVHTQLVHTQLVHPQLVHTQVCTHNLSTHNLSTHTLSTCKLSHNYL